MIELAHYSVGGVRNDRPSARRLVDYGQELGFGYLRTEEVNRPGGAARYARRVFGIDAVEEEAQVVVRLASGKPFRGDDQNGWRIHVQNNPDGVLFAPEWSGLTTPMGISKQWVVTDPDGVTHTASVDLTKPPREGDVLWEAKRT